MPNVGPEAWALLQKGLEPCYNTGGSAWLEGVLGTGVAPSCDESAAVAMRAGAISLGADVPVRAACLARIRMRRGPCSPLPLSTS